MGAKFRKDIRNPDKVNPKYHTMIFAKDVKAGEGYMKDGRYVAYTSGEKEHVQGVNENKNMEYTDTAPNSALGTYNAEGITAKTQKKKLKSVFGGGSILGG